MTLRDALHTQSLCISRKLIDSRIQCKGVNGKSMIVGIAKLVMAVAIGLRTIA